LQARLAAALHWLEPYAAGKLPLQEFVHSTVRFDARRAAAHVEGYPGPWRLDPGCAAPAAALEP
jgi:hypothetical protein